MNVRVKARGVGRKKFCENEIVAFQRKLMIDQIGSLFIGFNCRNKVLEVG